MVASIMDNFLISSEFVGKSVYLDGGLQYDNGLQTLIVKTKKQLKSLKVSDCLTNIYVV